MKLKTVPWSYGFSKIHPNFKLVRQPVNPIQYETFRFRINQSSSIPHILLNRVKGWLERGVKVKVYLIAVILRNEINELYYMNYSYHNFIPNYKITRRWICNEHIDCRSIYFSRQKPCYKRFFYKLLRTRHLIHDQDCPKKSKFQFNQLCEDLNFKIASYVSKPLKCAGNCGRIIQCGCICEGVHYSKSHWHHCKKCGIVLCKQCIKCSEHDDYNGVECCAFCLLKKPLRQFKCTINQNTDYDTYSNLEFIDYVFFDDVPIMNDTLRTTMSKFDHETHDKVVNAMLSFANERNPNLCCQSIYCDDVKMIVFNPKIYFYQSFILKLDYPTRNKCVDVFFEQAYNIMPNACCESINVPHMIEIFPEKLTEQELEIRKKRGIIYG